MKKTFYIIITMILFLSCNKNLSDNEIVFNLGMEPSSIDPHLMTDTVAIQVHSTISEGLLRYDERDKLIGAGAKNWTKKDKVYTFYLRKDAKWSNGLDVKAQDYYYGFKRALDPEVAGKYADYLFYIKNAQKYYENQASEKDLGIKVVDDYTFEIELEKDIPYFEYILTLPITRPLNEKFYLENKEDFAEEPSKILSNGPYEIESWIPNEEMIIVKNKNYWNKKNIHIPKIKYVMIDDFGVVDTLIENKEIDMSRIEAEYISKHKNNIDSFDNGRIWYLQFNFKDKKYQNENIRKAIEMSIDKDLYVSKIKNDGSEKAIGVVSKVISGNKRKYREEYPIKEKKAENPMKYFKQGLKELGEKSISIDVLGGNSTPEKKEIQYIQEQLRSKLGVDVSVQTVPFKERLTKTRNGDYEIVLNTWSPKYDDPLTYFERWYSGIDNDAGWSNKKYNELIDIATKEENNKLRMNSMYEAEQILIDEVIIVPLYFSNENHYIRPGIKGVIRRPLGTISDFYYAKLRK